MSYRVIYSPTLCDCIEAQVDYLRQENVSDETIERWFDQLYVRLNELGEWPRRYPQDERLSEQMNCDVRRLIHGQHVVTYLVDDRSMSVHLLAMVHGATRK